MDWVRGSTGWARSKQSPQAAGSCQTRRIWMDLFPTFLTKTGEGSIRVTTEMSNVLNRLELHLLKTSFICCAHGKLTKKEGYYEQWGWCAANQFLGLCFLWWNKLTHPLPKRFWNRYFCSLCIAPSSIIQHFSPCCFGISGDLLCVNII